MERTEIDRENFEALIEKDFIESDKQQWVMVLVTLNFKTMPYIYYLLNGKEDLQVPVRLGFLDVSVHFSGNL